MFVGTRGGEGVPTANGTNKKEQDNSSCSYEHSSDVSPSTHSCWCVDGYGRCSPSRKPAMVQKGALVEPKCSPPRFHHGSFAESLHLSALADISFVRNANGNPPCQDLRFGCIIMCQITGALFAHTFDQSQSIYVDLCRFMQVYV